MLPARLTLPPVRTSRSLVAALLFLATSSGVASATSYNLESISPNAGFESGLTGWSYTGAGVNANTYLTNAEWSAGTWSSSSPFYTDANLTGYYPGKPWGLNPAITHIDQTGIPGDPTVVISAAVSARFVGSRQDGYEGHYRRLGSEPPQPAGGFYDTNWQLTSGSLTGPFLNGDTFTLVVWGVRGRLNADWSAENANSAGSASTLNIRLLGGSYVAPTVAFTSWAADGQWAYQTCTWQLTSNTPSIQIQVTAQNKNHDRFVAYDAGQAPLPVAPTTWSRIKQLTR